MKTLSTHNIPTVPPCTTALWLEVIEANGRYQVAQFEDSGYDTHKVEIGEYPNQQTAEAIASERAATRTVKHVKMSESLARSFYGGV